MGKLAESGIVLRKFESRDVQSLYHFRNDPFITIGLVGFSTGYSSSDLENWVEAHRNRSDEELWAIADSDSDVCVGHVGLYQIDHRIAKAEFAILIGEPSYQGKGLGRAISQWVVDFGFAQLNLNKISLTVLPDNERAISLYQSLGFVREGTFRDDQYRDGKYLDVIQMSLLRDEWKQVDGINRV